ncbi:hypothetical protein [Streptomyces bohaiensis]|uniref:DUF3558 domain-containing protein n=1 Tax=Streptomyces bohaiensis TaxID=1431344 RepID=A0ABX1CGA5_9ACTN|nr:hypothetical protein [Streptomyces bohaiensis]NJQ16482.1 hypothetical protein [Streptomyces bohaiensis]
MTAKHWAAGAGTVLALLSIGGCTSSEAEEEPERLYQVPQSLCDIPPLDVNLEPIFVSGERLEVDHNFVDAESGTFSCQYRVDGVPVIDIIASFYADRGVTEPPYDYGMRSWPKPEAVAVPGPYEAYAWPGLASAAADCTFKGETRSYLARVVTLYPDDEDLALELVSELIQPVTEHAQQYCNTLGSQAAE